MLVKFWSVFFWYENFTFLVGARDPVGRFKFPLVPLDIFMWGFRFSKRELLNKLLWKVWMSLRFDSWWWKFRFSWKIGILVKFREELSEPKGAISGRFGASKSTRDLRCAQCSEKSIFFCVLFKNVFDFFFCCVFISFYLVIVFWILVTTLYMLCIFILCMVACLILFCFA